MDLARCGEIGRSQDGLITRTQALQFLSPFQIERLVQANVWTRFHRGVYAGSGTPHTWKQRLRAATLARVDVAVASHQSAAYLLGLLEWQPRNVEILVPFGRSPALPGVRVHRTRNWHEGISSTIAGIPVTTPARTIIDLSAVTNIKTLRHAIDLGITAKIVRLDDIAVELELIGSQGRSRCTMLFDLLALRDEVFERADHTSEVEWLERFRNARLPVPVPQFEIPLSPTYTARPDFAYPDLKIAIEVVSWRWHGGPSKFEEDITRRAKLRAAGWLVVEISTKTTSGDAFGAVRSAVNERRS